MAKTTACTPKTIAAASGLTAETIRMMTRTAVVTEAANRGPRTSTWSGRVAVLVVLLVDTVLLLHTPVARKGGGTPREGSEAAPSARATARRLSSYSNNNSPRCGTDRLRDAW